jgi:drug/metabolite transporter (DMT)-like permease
VSLKKLGVIWMLVSASAYSMFTVFGKTVLKELEAIDVLLWRFFIAVPAAWLFIVIRHQRGGPSPFSVAWKPRFAAGLVFGSVSWLAFAALDRMPGALYIVIIYTYPAMVAVGAYFLGRPTSKHVWMAIAITLVGIALTVPEVINGAGSATVVGLILTLGNALMYATYMILSERLVRGDQAGDGLVASAWSLTGSLAFAVVIAIVKWPPDFPDTLNGIGSMFGLALISTVIASMGFFLGVRHLGPASAALVATTEPVLTLIWVVIIFGDSLKAIQLLGAALVIIGVVWSQRTPKGFTTGDPDESHLTRA